MLRVLEDGKGGGHLVFLIGGRISRNSIDRKRNCCQEKTGTEKQHGVNIMALEFKSGGFGCGQGRGRQSLKSQDVNERFQRDAMLDVTTVENLIRVMSDVEKGGETVFPSAKPNISVVPGWNELSKSGKKGLFVKPTMGDPLLFWSMKPDGSVDPLSLHASLTSSANSTLIPFILIIGSSVLLTLGILLIPKSLSNWLKAHYRTNVDREDQSVEVLSSEPRAVIFHNFLSPEECDYLISLANPHMSRSMVIDSVTGKSIYSSTRTSSSMYLARGRDKMIQSIEKRIANITSLPVEHRGGLQIILYKVGQMIENHHDYLTKDFMIKNGGQRLATVLMYLSDVEEGGETVFPSAKGNVNRKYGKNGLSIKPKKGDALLFYSMKPDASLDPLSLHGK
ncbi:Oxoglutarate/iron-dependent dioxygenase [Artemisia annua]|uniref:Oxoglutarate/iron-dependent dioxygenase n=1 Tax=Artemisia annua TaxID=35608 RepID=A0A2U1KJ01_ARTAN|nr:Oxoglutarate/iron-dependent dioxygenase [Artemisia annua]